MQIRKRLKCVVNFVIELWMSTLTQWSGCGNRPKSQKWIISSMNKQWNATYSSHICNVFSHRLRSCSAIDSKRAQTYLMARRFSFKGPIFLKLFGHFRLKSWYNPHRNAMFRCGWKTSFVVIWSWWNITWTGNIKGRSYDAEPAVTFALVSIIWTRAKTFQGNK